MSSGLDSPPMTRSEFYQDHLNRVSRSFAFCIEQLDAPLREWIGLAYVLCRIVDTIEDSQWPTRAEQLAAYDTFLSFSLSDLNRVAIADWVDRFPEGLPVGEQRLLRDAGQFFNDLHHLPPPVGEAMRKCLRHMTLGMRHFSEHHCDQENFRLDSLPQVNQYCFFVAGIIGELLSELLSAAHPDFNPSHRMMVDGFHFGLYLQKINILKDQMGDEKLGRHLVPSRADVRASLMDHAAHSLRYIENIPVAYRSYRIFCAWSFFLGLISLPYIDKSWDLKKRKKISRLETFSFLKRVASRIDNNEALRKLAKPFGVTSQEAAPAPREITSSDREWLERIYSGNLHVNDLAELGLL